jgi:hypothetical protein
VFEDLPYAVLEAAFRKTLRECKYWPIKVSDIREYVSRAEGNAASEAAERAWQLVFDLRRVYWNPDIPGPLDRAVARLSERVRQAARASGVFRDYETVDSLHVSAKKRFVESFIAYGELEQDKFLLPDGEIKKLLAGVAETKALPPSSVEWSELHARGLEYAKTLNAPSERLETVHIPIREISRVIDVDGRQAELQRQAEMIREKYPRPGNTAGSPPELQPTEAPA